MDESGKIYHSPGPVLVSLMSSRNTHLRLTERLPGDQYILISRISEAEEESRQISWRVLDTPYWKSCLASLNNNSFTNHLSLALKLTITDCTNLRRCYNHI